MPIRIDALGEGQTVRNERLDQVLFPRGQCERSRQIVSGRTAAGGIAEVPVVELTGRKSEVRLRVDAQGGDSASRAKEIRSCSGRGGTPDRFDRRIGSSPLRDGLHDSKRIIGLEVDPSRTKRRRRFQARRDVIDRNYLTGAPIERSEDGKQADRTTSHDDNHVSIDHA